MGLLVLIRAKLSAGEFAKVFVTLQTLNRIQNKKTSEFWNELQCFYSESR
jgi:peroxiredoxin family protein